MANRTSRSARFEAIARFLEKYFRFGDLQLDEISSQEIQRA